MNLGCNIQDEDEQTGCSQAQRQRSVAIIQVCANGVQNRGNVEQLQLPFACVKEKGKLSGSRLGGDGQAAMLVAPRQGIQHAVRSKMVFIKVRWILLWSSVFRERGLNIIQRAFGHLPGESQFPGTFKQANETCLGNFFIWDFGLAFGDVSSREENSVAGVDIFKDYAASPREPMRALVLVENQQSKLSIFAVCCFRLHRMSQKFQYQGVHIGALNISIWFSVLRVVLQLNGSCCDCHGPAPGRGCRSPFLL